MAITLYEKTSAALIPSGERTVATYASGLVRVDQVYICSHDSATTHRAALIIGADMPDGIEAPASDGLYIFPTPQEVKRPDGFTEFHVSAYGRAVTGIQGTVISQVSISNKGFTLGVWQVSGSIVIPATEFITLEELDIDPTLFDPFGLVFRNPTFDLVSISNTTEEYTGLLLTGSVTINGKTYSVPFPDFGRDIYTIKYTAPAPTAEAPGATDASTYQFALVKPKLIITASRNFGKWTELEIATEREGTTPEII